MIHIAYDKIPKKRKWKKGLLGLTVWGCHPSWWGSVGRESMRGTVTLHVQPGSREMNTHLGLGFFSQVGVPVCVDDAVAFRVTLLSSAFLDTLPQTHPEACFHDDSKSRQVDKDRHTHLMETPWLHFYGTKVINLLTTWKGLVKNLPSPTISEGNFCFTWWLVIRNQLSKAQNLWSLANGTPNTQ